jgi:uncharacterized NAD(P)/FAD-binding protein YdhS
MVDTVIGLREQGYNGIIYSVSPNGFNILPHRHNGLVYTRMIDELTEDADLYQIVCLFNKHRKQLKELGVSPEPLIDSMRVYTQHIWKRLSMEERKKFMGRLRHLWGVARHRIPLHIYEWLQQQRIEGKLHVQAGRLMDIHEEDNRILVHYFDKRTKSLQELEVGRVINCTGPESDLKKVPDHFLCQLTIKGIIQQDALHLGIVTHPESFEVINDKGERVPNVMTLGANLRGELWESTAVNELRQQAEALAQLLLQKCASPLAIIQDTN